ncbi:cellulose biosynthesis protein BcsD [Undibacterium griseum]|uniref:Cellulose synthase subunit D n=1 Tax=Undibacterium griseum TaxID=2762295 RepID=A0ABR6YKM0_9BURK|nr:cellulose biosynthesis protein BcsD [Undibacterium griseum]MBC3884433.1 hypothetical protein [Undibacterium griseum]
MFKNNAQYYEAQQCPPQWKAFLAAFSAEFASKGETRDLRALMHQLGRIMAKQWQTLDGSSLQALEDGINAILFQMNWGWIEMMEERESLIVAHHASPLKVAFGAEALPWSPALLEGIYAQIFEQLGMDQSLRLSQRGEPAEDGQLFVYELKKQQDESHYFARR